jgi:hypothetical protein
MNALFSMEAKLNLPADPGFIETTDGDFDPGLRETPRRDRHLGPQGDPSRAHHA